MSIINKVVSIILLTQGTIVKTFPELNVFQSTTELTDGGDGGEEPTLFLTHPGKNLTVYIVSKEQIVTLTCDVDGKPKPFEVEWTMNGFPLAEYSYIKSNLSLIIEEPHYSHSGQYSCNACNHHMCLNSTVSLLLIFQIDEESMNNKTVTVGNLVVMNCFVKTKNYERFFYGFFKTKLINEMDKQRLYNIEPLDYGGNHLVIEKTTLDNAGWYTCVALGDSNRSNEVIAFKNAYLEVLPANEYQQASGAIIAGATVLCIALVLVTLIFYRRMKLKKKYYKRLIKIVTVRNQPSPNDYVGFQMPIISIQMRRTNTSVKKSKESVPVLDYEFPIDRDWEFPRKKLTLGDQLGAGAFGKVVMANAEGLLEEGVASPVAVKMLKDEHTDEEVKDLVCEMEIMKNIGKHPNIINLLGSCTQDGPLLVIVEYAAHGNLKNFLQNHRFETSSGSSGGVKILTTKQLVTFASQIASGMHHLSSIKLIHRDLAARNILVSEGCIMKIADFGLARDVYNQEYYRKITTGKLPIRWMAPESLEERFFDTKSDVWSFGVLLWEIMTLGQDPYPFVADWQSFLEYLKQGKRLEHPAHCPERIYHIMEACWEYKSEIRPTFGHICFKLELNGYDKE